MKKSSLYLLHRIASRASIMAKSFFLLCISLLLAQAGVAQIDPAKAITLNAVNQYCTMVQSTAVTGDFTVEAWIRPDATADRSMSIFSSRYNVDYSFDMKIDFVANGNSTIKADIGNGTAWLNTAASVAYNIESRHWYHIAYTVSGSANQYIIYVNGRQVGSGAITGGASVPVLFNSTHTNANIGKNEATQSEYFLGLMDEVRIYSRVISATEMLEEATGASISSTGRVKYFSFENASGSTFFNVWNSSDILVYQGSAISTQTSYALVLPEAGAATSVTPNSFRATWSPAVSGAVSYYLLDVATDPNFTNTVINAQRENTSFIDEGIYNLQPNTQYYYRIRANHTGVTIDSYGAYSNTVSVTTIGVPTISSFTPASSFYSSTVTITGTNFTPAATVKFGNTNALSVIYNNVNSITATVGNGSSGMVSVTTLYGTANSGSNFTYLPPSISSFTPSATLSGGTVAITGTNFLQGSTVQFGGTDAAAVVVNGPTSITATVGNGSTGVITVTNPGGTATSSSSFTYFPNLIRADGNPFVCSGNSSVLTAVGASGASYEWYSAAAGGSLLASTAIYTTPLLTTDTHFFVQQTLNGFTSGRYDILVKILDLPGVPTVSSNGPTTVCQGSGVTLTANSSPEKWTSIKIPMDERQLAVSFTIGNKAYIGTGQKTNVGDKSDFWEFDPASNLWTQKADYAGGAVNWAVGMSIGSKGYIGTGQSQSSAYKTDFWEYDPATNKWLRKADVPGGGRSSATGFSIGNKGYVGGGIGDALKTDFYEYNPTTDSWRQLGNTIQRYYQTSFTIGNKGYIFGGVNAQQITQHDIWEYDPNTDTWTYKITFNSSGLRAPMSFSIGNKAYILGGQVSGGVPSPNRSNVWSYDPVANSYQSVSNMPYAKANGVGFSIGTRGYIAFGDGGPAFYEYNPGYSLLWSPGGATTASNAVTTTGNYNVTVTSNNNGCTATSATTPVNLSAYPTIPVITPSGPTTFCAGGSVTLTAPAGFTYLWSPGNQTTQSISVATAGNYTATVTNATGCGTTSSATVVTVNALPSVPAITAAGATTFCAGSSVKLSTPAGASSYLWKLNGSTISGGATIRDTTINTAGSYTITVTYANGCANTSAATVVTVNALPTAAIVAGATSVCSSKSITLLARKTGTVCATANEGSVLSIQAPAGAKFTALVFASYGTPTGTCGNFVKSSCHAANSESFVSGQLLGNSQASIFASAANFGDPCFGLAKKLYVEARYTYTDAVPTDTYLWSNTATTSSIAPTPTVATNYTVAVTDVNGCVDNASLNISVIQPSSSTTNLSICPASLPYSWNGLSFTTAGSKTATLVNAAGCDSLATLNLTVNAATAITSSTGSQAICAGGSASFTVAATGTNVTYQWFKNGTTLGVGFTAATLSFANITAANAGSYTCTVTGACGVLTSTAATLTVNTVTAIATSPTDQTICAGGNASFTVTATGTSLTYQWFKDGNSLGVGFTAATLSFANITAADAGSYTCTVTGACGALTSTAATLTINTVTAIVSSTGSQAICADGNTSFTVAATGTGTLSYQWKRGSANVGNNSATLSLTNLTTADEGLYTCVVTGTCGSATTIAATLTVNAVTAITTSPTGQTVCAGSNTSFTVAATGTGTLSYQWKRSSTNVGGNSATLSLTNITATDAGAYTCVVSSTCGNATTTAATLTVNAVTAITTSPTSQAVCAGGNASFTVDATGVNLSYQWEKDGTNVGINSATLSLTNVTAAHAGSYTCMVTGVCGYETTTAANLVINPLPNVVITTTNSSGFTICDGGSITLTAKTGGTVCATAAEGGSVHLQAPANTHFTAVAFASYGNPWGSCGSFAKGEYHAAVSESEVASRLIGNTDVTIDASNDIFGDPSYGVAKYLYIEAQYQYDNAPTGSNYQWSTGANSSAITVTPTAATTYTVTATNTDGCSTTASKAIGLGQSSTSITNITVCSTQLPYLWNNLTFNATGSQTVHLTNRTGCDSTATLNITLATDTTLYVDSSVVASGNGLSWSTAYKTLSEALDIAQSGFCFNTVLVANGTYYTTGTGYKMRNDLAIYGGFDPQHGITALGDTRLLPTSGASGSILSGQGKTRVVNNIFTAASPLLATAVLDGFTLTAGGGGSGSALYNSNASPTVSNCVFTGNNVTSRGASGGIYCQSSSSVFTNCVISNNTSADGFGGVALVASNCTLINCTITKNVGLRGGGVYLEGSFAASSLINCVISNNISTSLTSFNGGGVYNFSNRLALTNCTIANNHTNSAGINAGGGLYNSRTATITNCIIWGNTGASGISGINSTGTATATNSLVQQVSGVYDGTGNINADPLFVDTTARNYRLQACSPAINKGENGGIPTGIATDLAAETRIKGSAVDMGAYEFAGLNNGNPNGADLLAGDGDAASATISGSTMLTATASSCRVVANILPIGPAPVSGNVTAKVWVDATQPGNYVKRHYQITPVTSDGITPAANAGTATGRVTLYFTQQEFDDFNVANTTRLPKDPTDEGNIPNLRIEKRSGTSSDGTGLPNTYPAGTPETFAPSASNGSVVWNGTAARWEVSFEVTGFSGFFVKTQSTPLPLRLISFSGTQEATTNKLQWQTADEVNTQSFELESSKDGRNFKKLASIDAVSSGNNSYDYIDATAYKGIMYYRLKMIDIDGTFTYSRILGLSREGKGTMNLYPNPVADRLIISLDNSLINSEAKLYNVGGRLVQTIKITSGQQSVIVQTLPTGVYIIKFKDGSSRSFLKE